MFEPRHSPCWYSSSAISSSLLQNAPEFKLPPSSLSRKAPFSPKNHKPTLTLKPVYFDPPCPRNTVLALILNQSMSLSIKHCTGDYAIVEQNNKDFSQGIKLNIDQHIIRPLSFLTEGLARAVRSGGVWCGSGLFSEFHSLLLSHQPAIARGHSSRVPARGCCWRNYFSIYPTEVNADNTYQWWKVQTLPCPE